MSHAIREQTVQLGDTRLRYLEAGEGTPVVMCHGFPGLAHSYRHQLRPVAEAGFRAVALDMLGYGGSSAPESPAAYSFARVTADLLALLDHLGAERGVFVGHDFGAPSAWNVAIRAPERVAGLVLLSVPYEPDRMPVLPSTAFASMAKKHFLHLHYFQAPGVAEAELDARPAEFLAALFHALSGAHRYLDVWKAPPGVGYLEALPEPPPLPWPWLSQADFDLYVQTFSRTGFRGGLNWYRAFDVNWELDEGLEGAALDLPALFVAGERDPVDFLRALGPDRRRGAGSASAAR
jgi:pimeloyl-ACP methyl ester carboxylesterase